MTGETRFDRLFAEGAQALLSGIQQRQAAPVENGPRWGMGVAMRPDRLAAQAIEHAAAAAAAVIGDNHWLAGAASRSHRTLRLPPAEEGEHALGEERGGIRVIRRQ